jgi:response regulator of citrate/malate metabolism
MTVTCGIVEDEALGAELLTRYISRIPSLRLKWTKASAEDLLAGGLNQEYFVNIIFLDLMSTASNLQVSNYRQIEKYGKIILTSAESETIIRTFPVNHIAILQKPVVFAKFQEIVQKILLELDPVTFRQPGEQ